MIRWIGEKKMDGWMHCWLVGEWIETKKWMDGWMDIYIKDGWLDGQRKNMDGYIDRKHGWLDGQKKWMVRQKIKRWMDGYTTIDGWLNGQKKKMKKIDGQRK